MEANDIMQNIAEKMAKQMKIETSSQYSSSSSEDEEKFEENYNHENNLCRLSKNMNSIKQRVTLKELIEGLYEIFESDRVNIEEVHALMSAYQTNPAEWLKYAKFDRYKYTRNMVDAGNDKFNLMILCWGEGQASPIHDHADAHCFMKVLTGNLNEIRYEWPDEKKEDGVETTPMKEIGRNILHTDEVCYINDSIGLHRVENLSYTDSAVSLHLYSPPFSACKIFDVRTGQSTKSQVTFWSVFGERSNNKSVTQSTQ